MLKRRWFKSAAAVVLAATAATGCTDADNGGECRGEGYVAASDTGIEPPLGSSPEDAVGKWLDTYGAAELSVSDFDRRATYENGPDSPIRHVEFVGDEIALMVHRARFEGQPVSWIVGGVRECADVTEWPHGEAPTGTTRSR